MPVGFEIESVWGARGRGFQMAAIEPDGITIHLTGQVAWDSGENIVGRGDVEIQTRKCFMNIEALLAEVGGRLSDLVSLTTYFTERSQLPLIQKIRAEFLPGHEGPVSTSVMVAGLGHEEFLVELVPVAVLPRERFKAPSR